MLVGIFERPGIDAVDPAVAYLGCQTYLEHTPELLHVRQTVLFGHWTRSAIGFRFMALMAFLAAA